MAQVKERGGLVLVSFLPRSKPKVPFQELFLLRNQTETLAIRRLALTIQTPVKFPTLWKQYLRSLWCNGLLEVQLYYCRQKDCNRWCQIHETYLQLLSEL